TPHRGADPPRWRGRDRPPAQGAPDSNGLPVVRPVPTHDGGTEHRLPAQGTGGGRARAGREGQMGGRAVRDRAPAPPPTPPTLRRRAAEGGTGPCHRP